MFTPCQVEPLQHELKKEEQEEEKDETHIGRVLSCANKTC